MTDSTDPYSDIPYQSGSHPQSHPDNLATIAALFGMNPAKLDSARVLEIGCASGANLLPMAAAHPGGKFVGVDLSHAQIANAQDGVDALKLGNVKLYARSLEEIDGTYGTFDYIIAHGLYSWVSEPVREQLMTLISYLLKPMGVAYVSYNTLPGSSTRMALREMVKFRTSKVSTLPEKVAKARVFFDFLAASLENRSDAYARSMREELDEISQMEDFYIAHEHLEETNEAFYFHEFMGHAKRHRLQFLGEAEVQAMSSAGFPSVVQTGLRELSASIIDSEQYGDFVRNRSLRQTLLCHAAIPLKRTIPPDLVSHFQLASSLRPISEGGHVSPNSPARFQDSDGLTLKVGDPVTHAALLELRRAWPASIPFKDLFAAACTSTGRPADARTSASLGTTLLACYSSSKSMEFHLHPSNISSILGAFPKATALARWQASIGSNVTNLRHENLVLGPNETSLLQKLDGTQAVETLEHGSPNARATLEQFAKAALLVK